MLGIAVISLFSMGLLASAFIGHDGSDDDETADAGGDNDGGNGEGEGIQDIGKLLHVAEDDSKVFGTAGDDTLTDDSAHATGYTVHGGDGDDRLRDVSDSSFLLGEGGDDDLSSGGYAEPSFHMTLDGGEGDDTLSSVDAIGDTLLGGDGDDRLDLHQNEPNQGWNTLDGGDGDDTLTADTEILDGTYVSHPVLTGGEGADTFDVNVRATNDDFNIGSSSITEPAEGTEDDPLRTGDFVTITDFDPAEDILRIDPAGFVEQNQESNPPDFQSARIDEDDDGSTVVLRYNGVSSEGDDYAMEAGIRLPGISGLTMNDIHIAQGTQAAA